jgi:hypothetical protein
MDTRLRFLLTSILKFVLFVSFCENVFLIVPVMGKVRFFRKVLRLQGTQKNFELCQHFYFYFSLMNSLYVPILVFPKFDPLTFDQNVKIYSP